MNDISAAPSLVVIDDQQDLCNLVVAVAQSAGYRASAVNDARPWLESSAPAPDVIILDLMMPGIDGIEVLRKLAQRHLTSRIIISSAHSARVLDSSLHLAKALGLRIAGSLRKPVEPAQLRDLLGSQWATPLAEADKPGATRAELECALERNQFVVHLQPQVTFAEGRFLGVEALVRWQHPQHGLMYPDSFIALAESNGLAMALTDCVLEKALTGCAAMHEAGFDGTLSINLPPVALTDVKFPEQMVRIRDRYQLDGVRLLFEITETSLPRDPAVMLYILTRLRLKGFELSIDDFGTGHSSLSLLHQLPFTELKLDHRFVRAAETDKSARVIVENSVRMGRGLGMRVVAEGVETLWQWDWLRDAGCDAAQGYFIGYPELVAQLPAWAKAWRVPVRGARGDVATH